MERWRVFFFYSSLSFSLLAFFSCKSQKKMKNKNKKLFPHNGVRSWLAYPESLCFQFFSLFLICCDRTRCTAKSIHSREDKKKTFPYCFWFSAIAQGAQQRACVVRENNNPRLKHKISNNKLIKYESFKKNKSVTVTLYLQICRNGCFWSKRKRFSVKRKLFPFDLETPISTNLKV